MKELDEILDKQEFTPIDVRYPGPHGFKANREKVKVEIEALIDSEIDKAVVNYRDESSTGNRPLSAPPLIIKQPVPCPRCGAEEYADWFLYPHQVYNSYMPGGIGHYCFPCFAIISNQDHIQSEVERKVEEALPPAKVRKSISMDKDMHAKGWNDCLSEFREKLKKGNV